jgi:hypothetical protein
MATTSQDIGMITMTTMHHREPIGPNDVVTVQGRYLVKNSTKDRFLVQGIAFPVAIPRKHDANAYGYDAKGWIAVLEQLARDTSINTVRVYQMHCQASSDYYQEFFQRAAELGIYVIVPLTASSGKGVLDRSALAPHCYPKKLYDYGKKCIDAYQRYPNVLALMIGNEVLNSLDAWNAAPCIAAYARDLKLYMAASSDQHRILPLAYATQHDSLTAEILPETAMKMTVDYLSCNPDFSIDIFGINVESWCSSLQTYEYNEDGVTESSYYSLHKALQNVSIPLLFSEMGCSRGLFNKDNGLTRYDRDWAQVPVVLSEMVDTFSGFCAYAYDGNPLFRMMNGNQAWNGHDVMDPSPDYDNFRHALESFHHTNATPPVWTVTTPDRPVCDTVVSEFKTCCKLKLYPMEDMPSYYGTNYVRELAFFVLALVAVAIFSRGLSKQRDERRKRNVELKRHATAMTTYQSINQEED